MLLAAISLAAALLSLVENPWLDQDSWLIPGITALLWFLMLYSLSYLFLSVPSAPDPEMGWRQRLSSKLRRGLSWIAGVLFLALTLALLLLSYQLLRVFLF